MVSRVQYSKTVTKRCLVNQFRVIGHFTMETPSRIGYFIRMFFPIYEYTYRFTGNAILLECHKVRTKRCFFVCLYDSIGLITGCFPVRDGRTDRHNDDEVSPVVRFPFNTILVVSFCPY